MARKKTLKVEDNPDLIKDLSSGAVINTNNGAYEARLAQIEKINFFLNTFLFHIVSICSKNFFMTSFLVSKLAGLTSGS